ncbi:deoxynucleoside kinase [Bacillus safensis]|uniref:deoxynucleoside kinase n=1 Tax=Bacillus TaxID=1386 RepID=UPI000750BD3C|nr:MULTISPECIES: deoxynucleoside kinase [Bacillus]KUR61048.1 deoxyguanosine kinase [Bacillus sp. AM 13(2015)]MCY7735557.1 deoxynucleoside kinase [Bacillus safensis]MEC1116816.1 deoxynucleoside kinase [Bacillus safensis]
MYPAPFIAVEGPIGAGKTTLATMLAKEFQFPLVKEIVEENPFLDKFYEDMEQWSFQLEMFFLCNRFKQLELIEENYVNKQQPVVTDYHVYKNMIFAERTLSKKHMDKYRKIYHLLTDDLPKPNAMIYIKASLPTLLERIQMRGRSFEEDIDPAYLKTLIEDYELAIEHLKQTEPRLPIITIEGDHTDFVSSQQDYQQIVQNIKEQVL